MEKHLGLLKRAHNKLTDHHLLLGYALRQFRAMLELKHAVHCAVGVSTLDLCWLLFLGTVTKDMRQRHATVALSPGDRTSDRF